MTENTWGYVETIPIPQGKADFFLFGRQSHTDMMSNNVLFYSWFNYLFDP